MNPRVLVCSSIASARARLCACECGSARVLAWLVVALRASECGSACMLVWLCARASVALRVCLLGSVLVQAQLCLRTGASSLRPMHIAKGPRPHVPPADQIVCPPPLLVPLLVTLSLSSTPLLPLVPPLSGEQMLSHPVPEPLVWAFRCGRPSGSLRSLVDIASCRRRAGPAGGRRRAGLAGGRCMVGQAAALLLLGRPATAGTFARNCSQWMPTKSDSKITCTVLSSPQYI
jgi:hypothetical protein